MLSWKGGQFNSVLNRPIVNDNAINRLSSGKAPDADAIPAEVCKAVGLPMAEKTDRVVSMHVEEGGSPTRLQVCFHNRPTNGKEILKSVTTTEVSLSNKLLERYWQKFY